MPLLCLFRCSTGYLPAAIQQRPCISLCLFRCSTRQPSSSGRASPSVCLDAVQVTSRQPSSSGRASPSVCAEAVPVASRQASSSVRASPTSGYEVAFLLVGGCFTADLFSCRHSAVAVPLPLSVQMQYRCSTGYLPQQQRTGGNRYCASLSAQTDRESRRDRCWMASREVTITAAAQIARERRGHCREVTVTARGRGTAAAEWLITLKVTIICMESILSLKFTYI